MFFKIMRMGENKKKLDSGWCYQAFCVVGITGFEPATPRPPDVYSNRTELYPERCDQGAFP